MNVVFAGGVIGIGGEAGWYSALYVLLVVEGAGVHTGLPWRLCGRHKKSAKRLPTADVVWRGWLTNTTRMTHLERSSVVYMKSSCFKTVFVCSLLLKQNVVTTNSVTFTATYFSLQRYKLFSLTQFFGSTFYPVGRTVRGTAWQRP